MGAFSSRTRRTDTGDFSRSVSGSKKTRKSNGVVAALQSSTSKFKSSFMRKTSSKDQTKPFKDLIQSWPIADLEKLMEEFIADSYLLNLQKMSDDSRKNTNSLLDDLKNFESLATNGTINFENETFKVHKEFFTARCRKCVFTDNSEFQVNSKSKFSEENMRNFIKYVYTEQFNGNVEVLEKMKKEFGCVKSLNEDCAEMFKNDITKGDLQIIVLKDNEKSDNKKSDFSISCNSFIASSRSPMIRYLLSRKTQNDKSIYFDDSIFPRSFALVFTNFLYSDVLDLSLVPSSDVTISSLSQAKAIISGKSPDIQLHRALNIMQVAKFFGVEKMVQSCEDVVVKFLTCDNCVAVLQWARDGGSKYIALHSMRLIENEFLKISTSNLLYELSSEELIDVVQSQFLQVTELEILEACIKWGEHDLLKKLEEREPNVVADTCHSISRKGLKRCDLSGEQLQDILKPLTTHIRKDYALPPFHQTLTEAYNRGILERAPFREDLVVCPSTSEINPDMHWLRPSENSAGPRYYKPYHDALRKHCQVIQNQIYSELPSSSKVYSNDIDLRFKNLYPEIMNDDLFLKAKNAILNIISLEIENGQFYNLPRYFHKNYATQLIVKRVLTEMDISEECFECSLIDVDMRSDALEIVESNQSIGSSCTSIAPDLLPTECF